MRIGIDVGGTKIEIAAFEDDGRPLLRRRVPSPTYDYDAVLEAIAGLVRQCETELGRRGSIGVGTPGATSPVTGVIQNANSTVLIGRTFERDIAARLARPVRIANDADCFALSEAVDGAGAGSGCVFGVILGTGVGGGIVLAERPLVGRNAIAGEWGHNPLPWPADDERPGPPCYCGKRGCIETFLSGPGLARDYAAGGGAGSRDARAVAAAAKAGEPAARAALERYTGRLARGLATVINVLDPDVVVLGGGVSNIASLYAGVAARLPEYVFAQAPTTPVRQAAHGDSSGVRGAAWLWNDTTPG